MRDLMFALALLALVPLAILRPVNAYLVTGWTSVLIPTSYLYGFMAGVRMNFLFAMLTILLVALRRVKWENFELTRVSWLLIIFLLHASVSHWLGFPGNRNNDIYYELLVKSLFFCLLMPLFIRERVQMHAMIIVLVLGMGIHGFLDGLKTLASGGSHSMYGPAGTMISDRNHLSTALAIVLPLVYYLAQYSSLRAVRLVFLGGMGLIVLAIMSGGSRGGFIALAVVGIWLILTSRRRWSTLALVVALASVIVAYAPDEWTSRLSTIEKADDDASFMGRVVAWKISSAIALDNPVFGGGFHAVQHQPVWDQYKHEASLLDFLSIDIPPFRAKAAHSIYFEVMGDMGLVGLAIFMGLLIHAIYSRFAIKRMALKLGPQFTWARDMADMLMLSVIAFMAGGAGVSLAYLEMIYMVLMLMEVLRLHVHRAHDALPGRGGVMAVESRAG